MSIKMLIHFLSNTKHLINILISSKPKNIQIFVCLDRFDMCDLLITILEDNYFTILNLYIQLFGFMYI